MDNSFQTSFIPQQPLLKVEGMQRRKEAVNIALVISLVAFFVVLTLAGGVYFWKKTVEKRILSQTLQLADIEKSLDAEVVTRFKRVDSRLVNAKQLLKDHTSFSVLLDFLEQSTAHNIGFSGLSYNETNEGITAMLTGQAPSYGSVYFQMETWRMMKPFIKDMSVNSISLSETSGVVNFEVSLVLNPAMLKYSQVMKAKTDSATSSSTSPQTP